MPFLGFAAALLHRFWPYLAGLLLAISVLTYAHHRGYTAGREEVRKEWAKSIAVANGEIAKKDAAYAALQGERDKAKAEYLALLNRPQPPKETLIVKVPTNAPPGSPIECPRLSEQWLQNYNAIAAYD